MAKRTSENRKAHLLREHSSGILVPPWWRRYWALAVILLASVSVIAALLAIGTASDRIADAEHSVANAPEQEVAAHHEEEPLPADTYDLSPIAPQEGVSYNIEDPGARYNAAPVAGDMIGPADIASLPSPDRLPAVDGPALLAAPQHRVKKGLETLAWRKFAVPFQLLEDRAIVVIVIDDMGVSRRYSEAVVDLPPPLTLSYLTYAGDLNSQAAMARDRGHEIMLHVPMEPGSALVDPGPQVLLTGMSPEEITARLSWGMAQLDGFVGLNNHMGSRFTADDDGMRAVLGALADSGHLFLDSRTSPDSVAGELAAQIGLPFLSRNIFIDHTDEVDTIRAQLHKIEAFAHRNGGVIAIGHPRAKTIAALEAWLPTLADKGLQLAPISALMAQTIEAAETPGDISSR